MIITFRWECISIIEEKLFHQKKEKLLRILKNASKTPYYRKCFSESGINLEKGLSYDDFQKIPILDKNKYTENKFDLVAIDMNKFDISRYHGLKNGFEKQEYLSNFSLRYMITSGSTGQPLEVLKGYNDEYMDYFTLNYYRKKMTNYDFQGTFVWVWPENPVMIKFLNNNPEKTHRNNYKLENRYGYKYLLHEHSEENFNKLYRFIVEKKCEWITSSPSILCKLAEYIKLQHLSVPDFKYIECHSERLHDWQLKEIHDVFGVKPTSIYSSNEVQFMAGLCENNSMHLFDKACFLEFLENENGIKEVCVTSLNYFDVPVIRYKLGDCGSWIDSESQPCQYKNLPAFQLNGVRMNDLVVTREGNVIEPFVITDSVYLMNTRFHLNIKWHRIRQTQYNCFEYFFPSDSLDISDIKYKTFLEKYLCEVFGYRVEAILKNISDDPYFQDGYKYKYFESRIAR